MKLRMFAAVLFLPLLFAILLAAPHIMTAVLFGVLSAFAAYELLYTTGLVRHVRLVAYSMFLAFLVPMWCYYGMDHAVGELGVLIFFVLMFTEMMLSHIKLRFDKIAICFAGAVLIPYLLSNPVRILMMNHGRYLVLIPFLIAFGSDSGAYFIGKRFGHRKLAPVISPNKTVEGVWAGLVSAVVVFVVYALVMQFGFQYQVNYGYVVIYAVVGSLSGVFGDLCFSVIKRQTGIKDYGNLIPGHGGILDRFDSMLVAGSVLELLLIFIPVVVK